MNYSQLEHDIDQLDGTIKDLKSWIETAESFGEKRELVKDLHEAQNLRSILMLQIPN